MKEDFKVVKARRKGFSFMIGLGATEQEEEVTPSIPEKDKVTLAEESDILPTNKA